MRKLFLISFAICAVSFSVSAEIVKTDTLGLDRMNCDSPASLLEGKVAGLNIYSPDGNPVSGLSVMVRGVNSLRTDRGPLWVIDGMPLGFIENSYVGNFNQLAFLNPYDIESIEVLKDASRTAVYGPQGAGGVIIVNTRSGAAEGLDINWNSNLAVTTPYSNTGEFRAGVGHNHSINLSSAKGPSVFKLSAQFRDVEGTVARNFSRSGNLNISYDTKANPVVWFGTRTMLSMGKSNSPSYEVGWLADYDDEVVNYRVVNSSFLRFNFTKEMSLNIDLGVDYNNANRFVWYGKTTDEGAENNGKAVIVGASNLKFNVCPKFSWNRFFGNHHIVLSAASDIIFENRKFNDMDGTQFFSHELRARGMNIQAGKAELFNYNYDYFTVGAIAAAEYAYKDIAGADLAFRANWTPRYLDSVRPYWSGNVWVKPAAFLKLSAGYGESGLERNTPYDMFDSFLSEGYPLVDKEVSFFYEALNSVRTKEWNVAAEAEFLKGRLTAGVKYFRRHTTDAFDAFCFGKKSSTYLWLWKPRQDFFSSGSAFTGSGVEADIVAVAVKTKRVNWSLGANFTWSRSLVTAVGEYDIFSTASASIPTVTANAVGMAPLSFVGYETLPDGSLKDRTGDGKITEADQKILGNPVPEILAGFNTTLKVDAFSLEAVLQGAALFDRLNVSTLALDGEIGLRDVDLVKGDYLRLQRLSAAYDINIGGRCPLRCVRVSLSGQNLFTLSAAGANMPDFYPSARCFVAGVKLIF